MVRFITTYHYVAITAALSICISGTGGLNPDTRQAGQGTEKSIVSVHTFQNDRTHSMNPSTEQTTPSTVVRPDRRPIANAFLHRFNSISDIDNNDSHTLLHTSVADAVLHRSNSVPDNGNVDSLALMHATVDTTGGGSSTFVVKNLQPEGIAADPGTAQVMLAKLSGRIRAKAEYSETITAPPGWLRFARSTTFFVRKQSDLLRMIPVSIPKTATAGLYTILYTVRSRVSEAECDSAVFTVRVNSREEIELEVLKAIPFVVGGTSISIELSVRNAGNTTSPVYLSLKSSKGYLNPARRDTLRVAPRQHITVAVLLHTGNVEKKETHILEAVIASAQTRKELATTSVSTDIIPLRGSSDVPKFYFPVAVTLSSLHDEKRSALQGEVSGAGYLDEAKTHRLSFHARGPNTQNTIVNGQRDEYRLLYQYGTFRIRGGDIAFSLSPLLEAGRYATGSELSFALGNVAVMSYYARDRWANGLREQAGASVSAKVSGAITGTANLLQKNDVEKSTVASVQLSVLPLDRQQLNVEYGVSRTNDTFANGHSIDFNGNAGNTHYDLKKLYGGNRFAGYVKDQDMVTANLSHYFSNDVRIEFSGRKDNRNLNNDSTIAGGSSSFVQLGTGYGNIVSLYFRQQNDRISYPGESSTREQQSILLRNGAQWSILNFLTSMELGMLTGERTQERVVQERYGAQASVQLNALSSISVDLDFARQNQPRDSVRTDQLSGGFSAFLNLFRTLTLRVFGNVSRQFTGNKYTSGTLESSLQYEIGNGHHIQVRGRYMAGFSQTTDRFSGALEYSVPLSVPLGRVNNVGILSGTLKDKNDAGIPNVILTIGEHVTVTGRDGRFIFSNLAPGENFLFIDRASLGVDLVPLSDNPLTVNVPKGAEASVTVTAVEAGKIAGTVDLFGYQNSGYIDSTQKKLQRIGGLEGIFVELKNERDVYRKVTDSRGNFLFMDLKPGEYLLSISVADLPDHHQVDKNNISVHIAPGEGKAAAFRIIPVIRTIKIIKKGVLE